MLIPGCVENCSVIIDFSGLGMFNVSKQALKRIIASFQNNYRARLGTMYILNVSFLVKTLWMIAKAFIDPTTKLKIKVTSDSYHSELLNLVHPNQLPKEFGGKAELPEQSWPPAFAVWEGDTSKSHITDEELKKRIIENPKVVPPPELAQFARENCKDRKKGANRVYYFKERIEIRDSFNGIIDVKKDTVALPDNSTNKKVNSPKNINQEHVNEREKQEKLDESVKKVEIREKSIKEVKHIIEEPVSQKANKEEHNTIFKISRSVPRPPRDKSPHIQINKEI